MNAPFNQPVANDPGQPGQIEIDFPAFVTEMRAQLNFAQERAALNASQVALLQRRLEASEKMIADLTAQLAKASSSDGETGE